MHAHEIARRMHKLDTKVTLAWLSYDFQLVWGESVAIGMDTNKAEVEEMVRAFAAAKTADADATARGAEIPDCCRVQVSAKPVRADGGQAGGAGGGIRRYGLAGGGEAGHH